MNATELKLLTELYNCILKAHDNLILRWLAHVQLEAKEVRVNVLEFTYFSVHEAQLSELLILKTYWVGSNLLNLRVLGEQIQQDEQLGLDEAEPLEISLVVAFDRVGDDVNPDEMVEEAKEAESLEETSPTHYVRTKWVLDHLILGFDRGRRYLRSVTLLRLRR